MSNAGWYPDPGGQPGLFRYWTGTAWTAAVTTNPAATPPPSGQFGASGQPGAMGGQAAGQYGGGQYTGTRKRGGAGWWIAGLAALVAVGLII